MTTARDEPLLYGASAAIWRERQVLLVQRGRAPLAGKWSLPGGLIEPGESAAEAAAREILEETGIVAEIERQIDSFVLTGRGRDGGGERSYHLSVFSGRYISGEAVADDDAADAGWFEPGGYAGLDLTSQTALVLKAECERLGLDDG